MTPETDQHSPLPWSVDGMEAGSDYVTIKDANGESLFGSTQYYPWVSEKDFPFIVRAMNCHEELLAALHEARYLLIGHGRRSDMIDNAIAKAEEK